MKNPLLQENNLFSEKDFKSPSKIYAPTYNWVWNGALSHEETDKQLDEFEVQKAHNQNKNKKEVIELVNTFLNQIRKFIFEKIFVKKEYFNKISSCL